VPGELRRVSLPVLAAAGVGLAVHLSCSSSGGGATGTSGSPPQTPHAWTFASLAKASNPELESLMSSKAVPSAESLAGSEFRGWNVAELASVLGIRKFIKGFFRCSDSPDFAGYNMPVKQNEFEGPWEPALENGEPVRHFYFGLVPGSRVSDAIYPATLVVDYRLWKGTPATPPGITNTVDYLVLPDPSNPNLVLGKSYLQFSEVKPFLGFFLIERLQQSKPSPCLAAPVHEGALENNAPSGVSRGRNRQGAA
jgi:hypothetical protein